MIISSKPLALSDDNSFSERLNNAALHLLVGVGMVFLIAVLCLFMSMLFRSCTGSKELSLTVTEFKVGRVDSTFYKANDRFLDSLREFNKILSSKVEKLEELNKNLKDADAKNNDLFKLFLAIIGAIFAIVGFFGFKSIYDTRESAVKTSVFNAEQEARRIATQIAKEEVASKYIDINIKISSSDKQISDLESRISDAEERIDELEEIKTNNDINGSGKPPLDDDTPPEQEEEFR